MKTSILIATAALCGLINADSIQAQSGQELFQQALAMERSFSIFDLSDAM